MPDTFLNVQELVAKLISLKTSNPKKKIAFVFSGGGARAAWFGGVLEAMEREIRKQQPNVPPDRRLAPDILVGTSGGALAALGYFVDLMNPVNYGPYANRQSWLWRELSRGNEAAFRLLDNPGMLELVSGSKSGKSRIKWSSVADNPILGSQLIANIPQRYSPTYNFEKLFESRTKLMASKKDLQEKIGSLNGTAQQLANNANKISSRIIAQNFSSVWLDSISSIQGSLGAITSKANNLLLEITMLRLDLTRLPFPNVGDALNRVENLIKDGSGIVKLIISELVSTSSTVGKVPMQQIKAQFEDLKSLLEDVKKVLDSLRDLAISLGGNFLSVVNRLIQILDAGDDVFKFIISTLEMIDTNASLMNTSGLKNAIHEILRYALPTPFNKTGTASGLDTAIFSHWQNRRNEKNTIPEIRAPELFLTASNITAGRLALLSLCGEDAKKNLGRPHTWVIDLNTNDTGFSEGGRLIGRRKPPSSSPKDIPRWIFGAWPNEYVEPPRADNPASTINNNVEAVGHRIKPSTFGKPSDATMQAGKVAAPPINAPFENEPGTSQITGTSILAAAALTSGAIPIAFPPKYWRFENPFLNKVYYHWFIDGGLADNRPIQHALDAGADYIVSFELTPLRKAVADVPMFEFKPNIVGVTSAIIDTPINSAFYRFLESYVAANPISSDQPPVKQLWRIAPDVGAGEEDQTIGVYDFNGYWQKGELKMGLFDWFMCGYLDAYGSGKVDPNDLAWQAYGNLPGYGQIGNAAQKRRSPGFFVVDFVNNKPHPGYP